MDGEKRGHWVTRASGPDTWIPEPRDDLDGLAWAGVELVARLKGWRPEDMDPGRRDAET